MRRIPSTRDGEKGQRQQQSGSIPDEGSPTHRQTGRSDEVTRARGSTDGAACLAPGGAFPSGRGEILSRRHLSPAHTRNSQRSRGRFNGSRSSSSNSNSNRSGDDDRNMHLLGDLRSADSNNGEEGDVRSRHENDAGNVPSSERVFRRDRRPGIADDSRKNSGGGGCSSRQDLTRDTETIAEDSSRRRNGHGKSRERSIEQRRGRKSGRLDVSSSSSSSSLHGGERRRCSSRGGGGGGGGGRTEFSSRDHGAGQDTTAGDPRASRSTTAKNHQQRRRKADERTKETAEETQGTTPRSDCGDGEDDDASGVVGRGSVGPTNFLRSNRGGLEKSRRGSDEAWDSESTATPSPRDPGGSVGEVGSSGRNNSVGLDEGGATWLEESRAEGPADKTDRRCRRGSRHGKVFKALR